MNALGFPDYQLFNGYRNLGIHFNNGQADANGCYWWLDGEIGGWDSPDERVTMLAKIGNDAAADGEIATDVHYKGRTLKFCLMAECPSEAARQLAWSLLSEVLDVLGNAYTPNGGVFFANEVVPVQLAVVRSGNQGQGKLGISNQGYPIKVSETRASQTGNTLGGLQPGKPAYIAKAEIELYAPDPRKYLQTPVTFTDGGVGHVTLNNIGGNTFSQACLLSISTSPGTGGPPLLITVSGTGFSVTMRLVTPTVPAGAPPLTGFPSTTVVDFLNKTITDGAGGNYYYLRDLTTPWPSFTPGAVTISTSPASAFSGSLYPAYI